MSLMESTKKSQTKKSQFQQLWEQAERVKNSNQKLEFELDDIVQRIEKELLPAELEMGKVLRNMLLSQLNFAEKKSLSLWHRDVLDDWIQENLSQVQAMGLLDDSVANKMAVKHARENGIHLSEDNDMSAAEQLDEYYDDELDDDFDPEEEFDDLFSAIFGEFDEEEEVHQGDFFDQEPDTHEPSRGDIRIDSSVFKRLFRQTAKALHPDKEPDESIRAEKQTLMTSLLEARRKHDLITMVQLHRQYVDPESKFGSTDEKELIIILKQYLDQQIGEKENIIRASPMRLYAFEQFYADTKKGVDRKVKKHLKLVEERKTQSQEFIDTIKNLKDLKSLLKVRYDAYRKSAADYWF